MEPIIKFEDFSFRYDSQAEPTLHNLNLEIHAHEKILVLGPSGSGKSTFGKCLNGLIPQAYPGEIKGHLSIHGKNIFDQSIGDLSHQVGTVLQDTSAQFVGLTVAEDVAFSLENDQMSNQEMHEIVEEWQRKLHLSSLSQHSPQDLSGGQKQRVSMAGVLIDSPDILLFDEPLANLDPASGYETMRLIDQLHHDLGTTIIIIEHRLEEVLSQKVDRILVFDQGKIIYDGNPQSLLKSNLLRKIGIRVPLYVSALSYAGVDLDSIADLDQLSKLDYQAFADKLLSWNQSLNYPATESAQEVLLSLREIEFTYPFRQEPALQDINLDLMKGQMVSIVGSNGAGKTSLAKLLAGFLFPDKGQIIWQGRDITKSSILQRAQDIGYVMQDPNQMISQHLIFDEVALGLRLRGVDEETVKGKVYQSLKVCGLYPFRDWPINALSFGQKKRVTIAAILVLNPTLLILDEPTAGQDFKHYREFMDFMTALNQEGMTILMITHDLQLMLEYTKRTLVMTQGRVIADLTPYEVLSSQELTEQASLRLTSLYQLAQKVGMKQPSQFIENFIRYEGEVMAHE